MLGREELDKLLQGKLTLAIPLDHLQDVSLPSRLA